MKRTAGPNMCLVMPYEMGGDVEVGVVVRKGRPSGWFACEEPERPTDPLVRWHYRGCSACRIKADALGWQHPNDPHVAWLRGIMAE